MASKHDSVAIHDAYQTLFEVSLAIWFHSSVNRFERDRMTFDTLTVILAIWIDYCKNIIRFWFLIFVTWMVRQIPESNSFSVGLKVVFMLFFIQISFWNEHNVQIVKLSMKTP